MPIRYTGDSMQIHRTDYLPYLNDSLVDITGSNSLRTITMDNQDIVVLPRLPRKQALVTLPIQQTNRIAFGLMNGSGNLTILALLGNRLLPAENISRQGNGYVLTLPDNIPDGRSFIRIFAQ